MKRVLLFACDPGGANTVIPLVEPLRARGYRVRLFGKKVALERYAREGLSGEDITAAIGETAQEQVAAFLHREAPDFLITGTSAEDFTEKYLWLAAGRRGVDSFAILDQWCNYGIRFSPFGVSNSEAYQAAPTHPFLPSRIIVMDDFAREEMGGAGIIEPDRILALGQPYFETFFKRREALAPAEVLRHAWGVTAEEFLVTFVSEPLAHDYGEAPDSGIFWGFTERTIFRAVRGALARAAARTGKKIRLIVKLHPRESLGNYDDLLEQEIPGVSARLDRGADPMELIQACDLVCGMSSMMLTEAAMLGKPVLSVLIGLKRESPFVLDRRGIMRSVRSESELDDALDRVCSGLPGALGSLVEVKREPVTAIIDEMERMLA